MNELDNILKKLKCNSLTELAEKYYTEFTKRAKELPYWINLVEAMNEGRGSGSNENGHTRFLYELFRYTANNTHPILNSFINRFTKEKNWKCKADSKENRILFNHTFLPDGNTISTTRHPDIYINQLPSESFSISVIIENKIDNAEDREQQVEDYIKGMYRDRKYTDKENCYAFYLIAEEQSKKTDKESESHDSYGRQKITDEKLISDGHYILLRYKEDILPWLKNEILVSSNEEYLIPNIILYVQYLESRFKLKEDINSVKLKTLKNMNGMENLKIEELFELQKGINEKLKEYIHKFANHLKKKNYNTCNKADFYAEYYKKIGTHTIYAIFNLQDYKIDMNCGSMIDGETMNYDSIKKQITCNYDNNYNKTINNLDKEPDILNKALEILDKELDSLEKEANNSIKKIP